ncbi:MAG: hypothetical protein ACREIV_10285, partial [Planctomycetaceae bacterium]
MRDTRLFGRWLVTLLFFALWDTSSALSAADLPAEVAALRPAGEDFTAASLRAYQAAIVQHCGGDIRRVPLDVKAEHLEWVVRRYMLAPYGLVHHRVRLPETAG